MNIFQRIKSYFQGVLSELRKVSWPPFTVVARYFVSIVTGVALAILFIGGIDYLFIRGLSLIIK